MRRSSGPAAGGAEDRGGRPETEADGRDNRQRENRRSQQAANTDAKVLRQILDQHFPLDLWGREG